MAKLTRESAQKEEEESGVLCPTFEELPISDDLLKAIISNGFDKPSEIQQRAILPLIEGKSVVAQAAAGQGKTAAFGIASIHLIDPEIQAVQVLVISPTRELADQTHQSLGALASYSDAEGIALTGGRSLQTDLRRLERGMVHWVSATPGRLRDLVSKSQLVLKKLRLLVLDEADRLLTGPFGESVDSLLQVLPRECRIGFFSATLPRRVVARAESRCPDAIRILVRRTSLSVAGIKQWYVVLEEGEEAERARVLDGLYDAFSVSQAVVFCNTRWRVEAVSQLLQRRRLPVTSIHGGMKQEERDAVMDRFRTGRSRLLVASDIWARGVDVRQVNLVINYDLPESRDDYLHRIGRSGRFGRKGIAVTLVTPEEEEQLLRIGRYFGSDIQRLDASE
eukprot:gnl/Dysnectes_brevis/3607_a4592_793.p1 GENE.gnl/Dysnectes_brevis/3607_a4592_793~~gnl/Dysnectes_brevis/3607_a4592_793.p1  ORF type:complete len:394 (-),score=40.62 gnl/Dysnectes_brevis/3607_a4592_793:64-1245(-)